MTDEPEKHAHYLETVEAGLRDPERYTASGQYIYGALEENLDTGEISIEEYDHGKSTFASALAGQRREGILDQETIDTKLSLGMVDRMDRIDTQLEQDLEDDDFDIDM